MTRKRLASTLLATTLAAIVASPLSTARGQDRPLALKGATIETVAEAGRIESGVVVLREGKIEAVGPVDEVTIPEDALVVDASGRTIMPGIVEPAFPYRGSGGGGGTVTAVIGGQVVTINRGGSSSTRTPPFSRSADLFDPYRSRFAPLLRSGLTHLDLIPPDYGQTAVIRTDPDRPEDAIVAPDGRLYLSLSNSTPSLDVLRRGLEGVRRASQGNRGAQAQGGSSPGAGRPGSPAQQTPADPSRDLWRAVAEGKAPLMVDASNAASILYLLDAVEDSKDVQIALIASGQDVYLTLDRLAERDSLTLLLRPTIDTMPQNRDRINIPRIVHERGIDLAFAQGSRAASRSGQDTPLFDVGYLIATGLDRQVALEALTSRPADLIGLGDSLGSIEPGKLASLLIFDGDPFDPYSRLRTVIIEGRTVYETE